MRVSERQRYEVVTNRVEEAKTNNTKMMDIVSSQKRINKLSDDPIGLGKVIRDKNRIGNMRQYIKNIDYSKGFIERTESSLSGIHDFLIRAKELAIGMANSTYGPESRDATSREVKEIVEAVVNLANTSFGNRYVFGGFRTQSPPVSNDGQYLGDDGAIFMQIDADLFQKINLQARGLFEVNQQEKSNGHFNMIQTLKVLYDGLKNDDQHMIRRAIDELDHQMDKTSSYQATLGAIYNALQHSKERLELGEELTVESMSKTEDADIFRSTSDFKRTETVLQSTLMASNKLLQPSLMNFLQ